MLSRNFVQSKSFSNQASFILTGGEGIHRGVGGVVCGGGEVCCGVECCGCGCGCGCGVWVLCVCVMLCYCDFEF